MSAVAVSVSEVTAMIAGAVATRPELEDVLVEGEISNLSTPSSGHVYFTLKDRGSALGCVAFRASAARIPFAPENGMTVVAHGHVEVYAQQGRYQLLVDRLEPSGVGALALAVEQRRRVLAAGGLFNEAHKRSLPLLPRRVAVVTSRTGAALRDVATVLGRRAPCVDLVLSPATVQGDGAAETIVLALRRASRVRGVELILLVRGGGSLEDLMAFNDEAVARAVHASPVPVITGIGHQTDSTIADLVADRRAPTPSAAAEMAVPDCGALRVDLLRRRRRLRQALEGELLSKRRRAEGARTRLDQLSPGRLVRSLREEVAGRSARLRSALLTEVTVKHRGLERRRSALALQSPERHLPVRREQLDRRAQRLTAAFIARQAGWRRELATRDRLRDDVAAAVVDRRLRLHALRGRLDALSPLRVLERGYSITEAEGGAVVTSVATLAPGTRLRTRLLDGSVLSEVLTVAARDAHDADRERMYDDSPAGYHEDDHA